MFLGRGTSVIFLLGCFIVAILQPLTAWAVLNGVKRLSLWACEDDILRIRCSHDRVLQIDNAEFGRQLEEVCPNGNANKSCSKTFKYDDLVKENCNGRQVCSMEVSTDVFGDPCPGVRKYMSVIYACVPNPDRSTTVTSSTTEPTTLSTPKPSTEYTSQQPSVSSNIKMDTSPTPSSYSDNNTRYLTTPRTVFTKRRSRGPRKCTTRPTAIRFVPDPLYINAAITQCEVCFTSLVFALMAKQMLTV